jgi:hypothetical protein
VHAIQQHHAYTHEPLRHAHGHHPCTDVTTDVTLSCIHACLVPAHTSFYLTYPLQHTHSQTQRHTETQRKQTEHEARAHTWMTRAFLEMSIASWKGMVGLAAGSPGRAGGGGASAPDPPTPPDSCPLTRVTPKTTPSPFTQYHAMVARSRPHKEQEAWRRARGRTNDAKPPPYLVACTCRQSFTHTRA